MNKNKKRIMGLISFILVWALDALASSTISIALPEIQKYFTASIDSVMWNVTIYTLFTATFLITISKLGDQFGRKKVFLINNVIFVVGSIISGFAISLPMLIIGRAMQGLAAAGLMVISMPLALSLFPKEKSPMVTSIFGATQASALAVGAFFSGFLIEYYSWRVIFYINIPIVIISIILCIKYVDEVIYSNESNKIDVLGILLSSTGLLTLIYTLSNGGKFGYTSVKTLSLFAVSIMCLVLFINVEKKVENPIFDLSIFKIKVFNFASLGLLFLGVLYAISLGLINFYVSDILGYSTVEIGLVYVVVALGTIISSLSSTKIASKINVSTVPLIGFIVGFISTLLLSTINPDVTKVQLMFYLFLNGLAVGLIIGQLTSVALSSVPEEKNGSASGISRLAFSVGVIISIAILTANLTSNLNTAFNNSKDDLISKIKVESSIDNSSRNVILSNLEELNQSNTKNIFEKIENILSIKTDRKSKYNYEKFKNSSQNYYKNLNNESSDAFCKTFRFALIFLVGGMISCLFIRNSTVSEIEDLKKEDVIA